MRRWYRQIIKIRSWYAQWHAKRWSTGWHALARWNSGWSSQFWHRGWQARRWHGSLRHWSSGFGETRARQCERGLDLANGHHFVHDFHLLSFPWLEISGSRPARPGNPAGRPNVTDGPHSRGSGDMPEKWRTRRDSNPHLPTPKAGAL
jgi:hypothetical protein